MWGIFKTQFARRRHLWNVRDEGVALRNTPPNLTVWMLAVADWYETAYAAAKDVDYDLYRHIRVLNEVSRDFHAETVGGTHGLHVACMTTILRRIEAYLTAHYT